jgi:integrase
MARGSQGGEATRSGDPYKPGAIRAYERALRLRVLDELGGKRLSDIHRGELQRFIESLVGEGSPLPSTIHNAFMPVRAIFRREVAQGRLAVNPTRGLQLPAVRGSRDRIADPEEAARLLSACKRSDQALWATALYAGLRRAELQALRWEDVDLAGGVIRVERSWDEKEGVIEPKSKNGRRKVPIAAVLRDHLVEHRMRQQDLHARASNNGAQRGAGTGEGTAASYSAGRRICRSTRPRSSIEQTKPGQPPASTASRSTKRDTRSPA